MSEWKKYPENKPLVGARYFVNKKNTDFVTIMCGERIDDEFEYFKEVEYPEPPKPEIKPCPICRRVNVISGLDSHRCHNEYYIACTYCNFKMLLSSLKDKEILIEKWNSIERNNNEN